MLFPKIAGLIGLPLLFVFSGAFSQSEKCDTIPPPPPPPTECIDPEPFRVVETMPLFPGCQDTLLTIYSEKRKCADRALMNYIFKNLNLTKLPPDAEPGTIVVGFTVKMDGAISDIEVIRSNGTFIDKKVMELIERMPKWEPGTQRGRPIDVKFYLPLRICLE